MSSRSRQARAAQAVEDAVETVERHPLALVIAGIVVVAALVLALAVSSPDTLERRWSNLKALGLTWWRAYVDAEGASRPR